VKRLIEWLSKLPENPRTILKTCAFGLLAGSAAVLFQLVINLFIIMGSGGLLRAI
jgi:hypothetical protein